MKPTDRREQDRLKTRAAILDATEALMREEGYAAVTSRRIAERAGLKSQLVHYHFGSMDELFQEAFRRNDGRFFAEHITALTSTDPLAAMWAASVTDDGMEVVSEYIAAANHRKVLQQELVQSWRKFRMLHRTMLAKHFTDNAIDPGEFSPEVLSFLFAAVGRALTEEARMGFSEGHAEVIGFVTALIGRLGRSPATPAARARRKRPPSAD